MNNNRSERPETNRAVVENIFCCKMHVYTPRLLSSACGISADLCFAQTSANTYCFKKRKKDRKKCGSAPKETRTRTRTNNNNSKQENLFRTFSTNRAKAIRQESVESTQRALQSLKMRGKMDTHTCTLTLPLSRSQLIGVCLSIHFSLILFSAFYSLSSFFSLHVHAHVQHIDMCVCIDAHTPLKPATFTMLLERTGEALSWKY